MTRTSQIFIVGMNGSGTTLLLDCLAGHSKIYGFRGETKVLPYYIARQSGYGDLRDDARFAALWREMRVAIGGRGWRRDLPEAAIAAWGARPRSAASIFDAILSSLASAEGKDSWCEKTPMYVRHIGLLSREFPTARFIHIIRDGRACAASFYRRWHFNPFRTMYRWKHAVRAGRTQGASLGNRYIEVRYEEFTAMPEDCLRQVCNFLEIPFEHTILQPARVRPDMTGSSETTIARNDRSASQLFDARMLKEMETIAGRQLAECGYPATNPTGDKDPPGWKLRWWEAQDDVRRFLAAFGTAADMDKSRRASFLVRNFRAAIRQKRSPK